MIKNFADHAANERTFLAWVRTAIAIVGFGVLVAKINVSTTGEQEATLTGTVLVVLGIALIAVSMIRFLILRRLIRSERIDSSTPFLIDAGLAVTLGVMLASVLVFGVHVLAVL